MNTSILAGSLLAALSFVTPANGQQVSAAVRVRSGPVAGHVVIGDGYSTYRRPVVYRREPARVIVIERVQRRHFHRDGQWRKHYRPVVVYYFDGRYYDRYLRGRPMREVVVYEREGRYYRECDDRYDGREDERRDRDDRDDRDWND
jgi:hypothetical protein